MSHIAWFIDIVSGRAQGIGPGGIRALLRVASWPMVGIVAVRNAMYHRGVIRSARVTVPVVSVGNITVGGTGKTPLVAWLAGWFRRNGHCPAILSRGYGSPGPGLPNDEAIELAMRLDGDGGGEKIPHLQNPDRVALAQRVVTEQLGDRIILDDGFQHRRLARDLDIVLLDATQPFGFGHLLPRGLLRESVCYLRRADVVILTRVSAVSAERREELHETVRRLASDAVLAELTHRPTELMRANGTRVPLTSLAGRPVAAFCGIGNPRAFLDETLAECGVRRVAEWIFPDHHRWTDQWRTELARRVAAIPERPDAVLCTAKDIARCPDVFELSDVPLFAVLMEIEWMTGREALEEKLKAL